MMMEIQQEHLAQTVVAAGKAAADDLGQFFSLSRRVWIAGLHLGRAVYNEMRNPKPEIQEQNVKRKRISLISVLFPFPGV
jgi:hypothetical protein